MAIAQTTIDIDVLLIIINGIILFIALYLVFRNYKTMKYLQNVYKKNGLASAFKEAFNPNTYIGHLKPISKIGKVDEWGTKESIELVDELQTIEKELFGVNYVDKHKNRYKKHKPKTIPLFHKSVGEHKIDSELKELNARIHGYTKFYQRIPKDSKDYVELGKSLNDVNTLLTKLASIPKKNKVTFKHIPSQIKERTETALDRELRILNARIGGYAKHYERYADRIKKVSALRQSLNEVDDKIIELNANHETIKIPTPRISNKKSMSRSLSFNKKEISKELRNINVLLAKSKRDPTNLLGKIKQKVQKTTQQEQAEALAISLVKKISRKIEGDRPLPPNEFLWVQKELDKVHTKIKKGYK